MTVPVAASELSATTDAALPTDTAGPARPLGAGDQPEQHDDQVTCPGKLDLAAEEDDRNGLATSTDD